ncbi:MAG: 4-(cytidine 5'-diphospho)-2-C-methyl-D-erythritol kinase [Bacilli bacterium]|nr:4-(cytidine 5'-diphospho)-2-C-methyl-D-erythritol kinase [Bacilli bacterium]
MNIKAHAKINLSLKVLGKLENGYHDLEMVNLPIELHDVIDCTFLPFSSSNTFITCNDLRLHAGRANLCHKAVDALREVYGFTKNFRIDIYKEIPFSAGLGGGSSDAAATLIAVNKMLKLGATLDQLKEIGLKIGSDVPFFLENCPCIVRGIGEKLEPISVKDQYECLIVKPEEGLSTEKVYKVSDGFEKADIDTKGVVEGLRIGDEALIGKSIGNDLMSAAESLVPEVGKICRHLKEQGFIIASMSGSGSSVFALTKDAKKAKETYRKLEKSDYTVILTKTMR